MKTTKQRRSLSLSQRLLLALIAVACIAAAWQLPLWSMKLVAPMYPNGLRMIAYGNRIEGDLYELNIVNHYVGMRHLKPEDISAMALFPIGLIGMIALALLPVLFPKLRKWCAFLSLVFPIGILAMIQYYLYTYGHGLSPEAPIKIPEFTPVVLGSSSVVNFTAKSMISWGLAALLAAPLIELFGGFVFPKSKRRAVVDTERRSIMEPHRKVAAAALFLSMVVATAAIATPNLQSMIDAAHPGSTLHIPAGEYQGPITISKPLTLIGDGKPLVRGNTQGDVVTIASNDVTFKGFRVAYSGIEVSQDAAGIRTQGNNVTVSDNEVFDVYFGIHVLQSDHVTIESNTIHPGKEYAGRPGHGINIWSVNNVAILHNRIFDARDGILLTYATNATVAENTVSQCRYALHSMYGLNITFTGNTVRDNLLGLALMYSKVLVARHNTISEQRRGSSPYGFLLKDIDNVTIEDNLIEANQVAIYAEGISMAQGTSSRIDNNTIVGNIYGLSVQSNAQFTFVGNNMMENLTDVHQQTDHINSAVRWSENGRGNYWSSYRGYDKNGDHIGDLPFRVEQIAELDIDQTSPAAALVYTPGFLVLESAARLFPIFKGAAVLQDDAPLTAPASVALARNTSHPSVLFSGVSAVSLLLGGIGIVTYKPFDRRIS